MIGAVTVLTVLIAATAVRAQAALVPPPRFQITCSFVKAAPDDPIVFPNRPGASHLHEFYGNRAISADTTTAESLAGAASSCPQNDRSAYWVPALYRDGVRITPATLSVYYENKSMSAGRVRSFPPGFKILMGNARADSATATERHWVYACSDKTTWGDAPPATCASGGITLRSEFPNCWDGVLPADGNATAHLRWADGLPEPGRGDVIADPAKNTCPAGYPIPLPMLRVLLVYPTGTTVGDITPASGSPYSKHGDFFNGWDPATLQGLVDRCLQAVVDCPHFRGTTPAADVTYRVARAGPSTAVSSAARRAIGG